MRHALLCSAVLCLSACDSSVDDPVVYQGVTLDARGEASLSVSGDRLVVAGLDGSRSGGFTVEGTPARVDVEIDPLAIGAGERFGVVVEDAEGVELASFFNEGRRDGAVDFRFAFGDVLEVSAVSVRYRLAGRVVLAGVLDVPSPRQGRLAAASAGSGEGSTGSTHVVRENGRYIVVSDSETNGARAGGCAGFLVTPPSVLATDVPICADWIEVEPLSEAPAPEGVVSVTARGVGRFIVNELAVR